MARIRTIKPEFWEDEKLAKLPMPCRLFYIGTWNFADDQGVFRGSPSILKSRIFPYDETLRASEVSKWIDALVEARMIIPVSYNNESYYIIRTFHNHQIIDRRYLKTTIPQALYDSTMLSHSEHVETTPQEQGTGNREQGSGTGNITAAIFQDEDPEFISVVSEWLDYKKSRRESYKNKNSVLAFLSKLKKLSKNDADLAREIITESMANNWAGIFPLNKQRDEPHQKFTSRSEQAKRKIADAAEDLSKRLG